MMLSLFFASMVSLILQLSHVAHPTEGHKMLCADGIIQPCPTFDMLICSDVVEIIGLTDWP